MGSTGMDEVPEKVRICARAAASKKASDLVALDMRGISSVTDFFLLATADSEPQLKAMTGAIREALRDELGDRPLAEDGFPASQWVVLDCGDLIVHLFRMETRERYGLESLWKDAPRIEFPDL